MVQEKRLNYFHTSFIFANQHFVEIEQFEHFGKDWRRTIPTIRFINSWKAWIWDQARKHGMDIWLFFETLKPTNQETLKPINQ